MQSKYILKERSKECLKEKLIEILEKPEILAALSQENLKYIKDWNWETRAKRFISLWESI
jgi:glycosyltransferase involved in cell wall biosynthesis